MATTWTARTVVELYNLVVWNERNIDLAEQLLADTVIRHEVGEMRTLTQAEAVQRVVLGDRGERGLARRRAEIRCQRIGELEHDR